MKKIMVLIFIVLIFTSCIIIEDNRTTEDNRTIENVYYRTIERNYSTYNVFMQYYLNDGTIMRKKIYKSTENRIDSFWHDDYINILEMYENNYYTSPSSDPQFGLINPNKKIKKILIIDIDTNTILKRFEYTDDWYFLGFAENNWDMRTRWEYWILDITNEWLMDS